MHSHAQNGQSQCEAMHRVPKSNAWLCTDWQSTMLQTIHDGFQHEQPDYWLNFGNPWEIVSVQEEGGRQTFRWNPGESVSSPRLAHLFAILCVNLCSLHHFLQLCMHVEPS